MKKNRWLLFLLGLLIACSLEQDNPESMELTIRFTTENPQCNGLKSAGIIVEVPGSQSCIEYAFDKDNQKLILKHLNAGFNCCPESLWCTVVYRNDTIIIQEFEKHMGCKCNCLYDLDMELSGIETGKYQIRVIEPYLGTQQPLTFYIDLWKKKQGSFSIPRTSYPWGQ